MTDFYNSYYLLRFCGVVGSNFGEPKVIRSHSLKLISTLVEADAQNPSLMDVDVFSLLVSLTYSLPSLFNGEGPAPLPSCNIQDQHIFRQLFGDIITCFRNTKWKVNNDCHQACPARPHDPAAGLVALLPHQTERRLQNSPSQRLPLCAGPVASRANI